MDAKSSRASISISCSARSPGEPAAAPQGRKERRCLSHERQRNRGRKVVPHSLTCDHPGHDEQEREAPVPLLPDLGLDPREVGGLQPPTLLSCSTASKAIRYEVIRAIVLEHSLCLLHGLCSAAEPQGKAESLSLTAPADNAPPKLGHALGCRGLGHRAQLGRVA